ncbi:SDR family oxidoreductase [Neobacillus sp. PS3-34]|uniref:SDR family oxidoreductase n=1 Tax=Neobacillus sp. PS3-34 TaxID=3070678 RepID=UPI0027E0FDDB|nr:SDR family oxidoreductase [Neobacillus sp. PS3-34]WML48005.1 SDR family oxidoreductase [Neobacillus sp. PS3-34]
MKRKTAIVTGSSSGFGMLCSLELAKKGFHVIATMRDKAKSETILTLAKEQKLLDKIEVHPLDVTSIESINAFMVELSGFDSIDVLVNNAGLAIGGFCEEVPLEEYRRQFETNFFGVISVTQALLPLMRANGRGRIINMSSISGKVGFPGLSPYVASKHALEGFSESLRLELKPFGIDVVLVEPGSYSTNIWSGLDNTEIKKDSPYRSYMETIFSIIESGKQEHGDPLEVAVLVAQIASQQKAPNLRYVIGKGVKKNLFLKNLVPWKIIEKAVVKRLIK